jgi:hypothetical protein
MTANEQQTAAGGDDAAKWRDVPIDWEALEDAFENNAPEVHSYLHVPTGDVLRIVDGIADPQMHARIAADTNYLRIEPVSSREQYRWMERFIPMVDDKELQTKLTRSIDGKGAFRRFKDVLMSYGPERERWFAFRSERLRIFMEAWLNAHQLTPVKRPTWAPEMVNEAAAPSQPGEPQPSRRERPRPRSAESLRRQLRDLVEALGPRDLDHLAAFGDFLRARRASARGTSPSEAGLEADDDAVEGRLTLPSEAPAALPAAGGDRPGRTPTDPPPQPPTAPAAGRGTRGTRAPARDKDKEKDKDEPEPSSRKVPARRTIVTPGGES